MRTIFSSEVGDPDLNGSQVIARTNSALAHTDTRTHTQTNASNERTGRPKQAPGTNYTMVLQSRGASHIPIRYQGLVEVCQTVVAMILESS